jgi:hypothetical protein
VEGSHYFKLFHVEQLRRLSQVLTGICEELRGDVAHLWAADARLPCARMIGIFCKLAVDKRKFRRGGAALLRPPLGTKPYPQSFCDALLDTLRTAWRGVGQNLSPTLLCGKRAKFSAK